MQFYKLPSERLAGVQDRRLDSAVTDVGCQPDRSAMTHSWRVASLRAFRLAGAAIQKVLLVGFLTHQVMVGFGMRVSDMQKILATFQFHKLMLDMDFQRVRLCKSYL